MFDAASEKWVLVWRYKYIFEIQIQNTECCDAGIGRRVGPLDGGDHSLRLQVGPWGASWSSHNSTGLNIWRFSTVEDTVCGIEELGAEGTAQTWQGTLWLIWVQPCSGISPKRNGLYYIYIYSVPSVTVTTMPGKKWPWWLKNWNTSPRSEFSYFPFSL